MLASRCPYPAPSFQVLSRLRCQGRLVPSTRTPPSAFRNGAKSLYIYSCVVAPEMPIIQCHGFTSSFSLAARTWFQQRPRDRFFWQSAYYKIKIPVWVAVEGFSVCPFPTMGIRHVQQGRLPKPFTFPSYPVSFQP